MNKQILPVVSTKAEMLEHYPITEKLVNVKTVKEWNEVREELKSEVPWHVLNFIDSSGLIKQVL